MKLDLKQKQNSKLDDKKLDYKFKILRQSTQLMQTDRKSFKKSIDKSISRTLRLKTDHT